MKNNLALFTQNLLRPENRVQRWTASIFVLALVLGTSIVYLRFQDLQATNLTVQHLYSYRHAELELAEGFLKVSLADNENVPFSRAEGLVLLDQALDTFEAQVLQLGLNDALIVELSHDLDNFRGQLLELSDARIDNQTWVSLWISYDHLQSHLQEIDRDIFASIENQANIRNSVFNWALVIGIVLFSGIALGVYGAEQERYQAEISRKAIEARYRSVVEDQTELICRYDKNFRLSFVNEAYAQAFGRRADEMLGQSLLESIPPAEREAAIRHLDMITPQNPVVSREHHSLMPDYTMRWFQWTDRVVLDEAGNILEYQGVGRDITARKQAEDELASLYEATSALFIADDLESIGQKIVETVVKVFDQADCGLLLLDSTSQAIIRVARAGQFDLQPKGELYLTGTGLVPQALRSAEIVYAPDVTVVTNYVASESRTKSELVIPLKTGKGVIGVLDLQHIEVNAFSERDQRILKAFAERAALAIATVQLNESLNRHAIELEIQVAKRTAELERGKLQVEAILNNSPDAILLLNYEMLIQQANKAFYTLFNYAQDDYFGKALLSLIPEDKVGIVESFIQDSREKKNSKNLELSIQLDDGSSFDAEFSLGFVDGEDIVCVIRDITERKAQELQLRFNASLQANVSDAVIVTDSELIIQSWNKASESIYGWTAEEAIGKNARDVLNTQYASEEARQNDIDKLFANGFVMQEVIQHHKTGGIIHILSSVSLLRDEENDEVIGVIAVNHDITARKEAETKMHSNEERLRMIVENIPVMIGFFDSQGKFEFVNNYWIDQTGWTLEELTSVENPLSLFYPDAEYRQQVLEYMIAAEPGWRDFKSQTKHRGERITSWANVRLSDGRSIGIGQDITERKEAEAALQKSSAEIHDLYNNAPCGYHSLDKNGLIVQINDTELEWLGYKREDVIGKLNFVDLLAPKDIEGFRRGYPLFVQRGSAHDLEFELIRQDGRSINVILSSTAVYDRDGQFVMSRSTLFDISALKTAQAALIESEERFRQAVINAPFPIMIHAEDGEILTISRSWTELSGYTLDEIPTIAEWTQKAYGIRKHNVKELIDSVYNRDTAYKGGEFQIRTKSGEVRIWDFIAAPLGSLPDGRRMVSSMAMDITERQRIAAELERQRVFLREVIDSSPSMIFVKDIDGRFIFVNPAMAKFFNTSVEDMLAMADAELSIESHELEGYHDADRRVILERETLSIEESLTLTNGELRWLQTTKVPLSSEDGQSIHVLGISTDITERKKAEIALRQALAKEKELGELKTRFVSMASHEFRTPLATILASVDTLSAYRHKLSDEKIEQRFDKIKEQIAHLKAIMEDVLLLARMQARKVEFNPSNVNIDALCRSVLDEFQGRNDIQHRIDYQVKREIPDLMLDGKLMRQVINNLVSNAIKYSPNADSIRVLLDYQDSELTLIVEDKGIGIPEADLSHLFEPFHRAANVETISGTGLGLVILKEAIELHGGKISIESQLGIGTSSIVTIPAKGL